MKRLVVGAALVHVAMQLWLALEPRLFASEDDGYRVYQAYLLCTGQADVVGRFWLPGPMLLGCPLQSLGVGAASAAVAVSMLSLAILAFSLAALVRRLEPRAAPAAWILVAASPLALILSRSALAELPSLAACSLAGLCLLRREQGGSRWSLLAGAAAMLIATWMRYESWLLAAVYPLLAGGLAYRRQRRFLADGLIAALAGLGPLAWMLLQWQRYGDAFTFLRATGEITDQAGHAGAASVVAARLLALATWAPAVLLFAIAARRVPRQARGYALGFAVWMALGVLVPALLGGEHPVFPDRLAFGLEVGLLPLAALAAAGGRQLFLALAVVQLALLVLRPPVYLDADAVRFGLALRAGEVRPHGKLLVERPETRPPLGWASVASAWDAWPRVVFATPRAGAWQLVAPTDVRGGRSEVRPDDLASELATRGIRDAWCSSRACTARITAIWPDAEARAFGASVWIRARSTASSTPR